ncbi:MAG: hypothetical protein HUK20_08545 [Fibrobacter sp.]|nr:hypothetical protein [Fibrobacter sp.]
MRNLKKLIFLFVALMVGNSFALDRIWDMRYTYGPEARPSPRFALGLGMRSDFGSNVLFPINVSGQISKDLDIGAKVDVFTYGQMENVEESVDFGGRFRFREGFLEVDGYFGLNRNNGSAVVLTYGKDYYVARNFSNYYEIRAGFLDGVTDKDGIFKVALGTMPTFHFGRSFRCMVEITSSGSVGHISDDFMVDIIPKIEISAGSSRIRLDFDIGVLQEDNNDNKTIALYVLSSF